jgi:hypothetical protein
MDNERYVVERASTDGIGHATRAVRPMTARPDHLSFAAGANCSAKPKSLNGLRIRFAARSGRVGIRLRRMPTLRRMRWWRR